jgi:hypothetical protein
MQLDGLAKVPGHVVERFPLRHHRDFNALGYIARLLARSDDGFDGVL